MIIPELHTIQLHWMSLGNSLFRQDIITRGRKLGPYLFSLIMHNAHLSEHPLTSMGLYSELENDKGSQAHLERLRPAI